MANSKRGAQMGGRQAGARGRVGTAAVMALAAAAAAIYLLVETLGAKAGAKETYAFAETGVKFPFGFEDKASAYAGGDKCFYLSTKDGIKYINSAGAIKWDKAYSMIDPVMKGRGGYAAVCDNKGYVFYMFGPDGPMHEKKFDFPILCFTVNARGDSCVLTQEGDGYRLVAMQAGGGTILEYVHADASNIPLCMDISGDGRIVAISFLDINDIELGSHIGFMYTSEEGRNYSKTFIGAVECAGRFVAQVCFMANNRLLCLSDGEAACVDVESKDGASVAWRLALDNKVDAFATAGDRNFAVAYGEALPGRKGAMPEGSVEIYDMSLNLTGGFSAGGKVTGLSGRADCVVMAEGRNFKAFTLKGAVLWEYTALAEARRVFLLETGNANSVLLLANTGASVYRRAKAS